MESILDTLLNTLDNPHLALRQWEEVFSVVQVIPKDHLSVFSSDLPTSAALAMVM